MMSSPINDRDASRFAINDHDAPRSPINDHDAPRSPINDRDASRSLIIGVTVIAGFLGSGKTTLLRRVVRDPRIGPKVAVIINELGALGLDEELVRAEQITPSMHMRQLVSGCICCTLRGELSTALQELATARGPSLSHILIETSGAARASEVSYAVNAVGFEAPFRTDAVLTLIDGHNAVRAHREHEDLFEDQVRAADVVLLNKADLLPDQRERAALRAWIEPLAPRATFVWTVNAEVDPALILGTDLLSATATGMPEEGHHAHAGEESRDPVHAAAHGLISLSIPTPRPLRREALEYLLEVLADRIFRIKGVVEVQDGAKVSLHLIQAVGDRIEMDEIASSSPIHDSQRRLIFIGSDMDERSLRASLGAAEAP